MDKKMTAKEMFNSGYNCSQTVFFMCSPEESLPRETKLALASGFGAGIGKSAETCGAVSGAIMAIGAALAGRDFVSENEMKADAYMLSSRFVKEFKEALGTISCRELLGYDLSKPEEEAILKEQGAYRLKCAEFVALAVEKTEIIIEEYRKGQL